LPAPTISISKSYYTSVLTLFCKTEPTMKEKGRGQKRPSINGGKIILNFRTKKAD
jgi:hypothetical protein